MTANPTRTLLLERWNGLSPRDRVIVAALGGAFAVLLVWLIAVRPAWRTLDQAGAQGAQADAALAQMRLFAAEAEKLRQLPPVNVGQASQVLKSATEHLGDKAKINVQSERATLSLTGASGADLQQWLEEVRGGAHARPVEANLQRAGDGYNGTLVVSIGTQ